MGFPRCLPTHRKLFSIEYVPYDKAYEPGFEDMMRRVPSVEKLQALTGFRPRTSLDEIIRPCSLRSSSKSSKARTYTA